MKIRMEVVRFALSEAAELLSSPRDIPPDRRTKVSKLVVDLQKQVCEDRNIRQAPGCLENFPGALPISQSAERILSTLCNELATLQQDLKKAS